MIAKKVVFPVQKIAVIVNLRVVDVLSRMNVTLLEMLAMGNFVQIIKLSWSNPIIRKHVKIILSVKAIYVLISNVQVRDFLLKFSDGSKICFNQKS